MIEVKCVDKKRDKSGKITDYKLVDKQGVIKILSSGELKEMMRKGLISVGNLTLTSDGRLIEKQMKKIDEKPHSALSDTVAEVKAQVQKKGGKGTVVKDTDSYRVVDVVYPKGNKEVLVIIKDSAARVPSLDADIFKNQTVRFIGGKNLITTRGMLGGCGAYCCIDVTLLDTSNVTDMCCMFCTDMNRALTDEKPVTTLVIKGIENLDTHNVENMMGMFMGCDIETINLSNFDTSNVIYMTDMFKNCKTKTLDLSSFDTSKVISMEDMFAHCKVKSLDLSNFDTHRVESMRGMFEDCKTKTLDVSHFDTHKVEYMRGMFAFCEVEALNLSSFNTSKVTDMSQMFLDCKIKTLDFSSFDTRNVIYMDGMFRRCKAENINLSSFNTSKVRDMSFMFEDCKAENINLSSFNTSDVDSVYGMFRNCQAKVIAKDQRILDIINKDSK